MNDVTPSFTGDIVPTPDKMSFPYCFCSCSVDLSPVFYSTCAVRTKTAASCDSGSPLSDTNTASSHYDNDTCSSLPLHGTLLCNTTVKPSRFHQASREREHADSKLTGWEEIKRDYRVLVERQRVAAKRENSGASIGRRLKTHVCLCRTSLP